MLSPRLHLTFLTLAASLLLHGSRSVPVAQAGYYPCYKTLSHEAHAPASFREEGLQVMYADLDEEDQDTESSFHSFVIIPIDSLHGSGPGRHQAVHFRKGRTVFIEPALIPFSVLYSVWRL